MRQLAMMQVLPQHPRAIATRAIRDRLLRLGIPATLRTIQRDLLALAAWMPIECDASTRPYRWRWAAHARPLPMPMTGALATVRLLARVRPHLVEELEGAVVHDEGDGWSLVEVRVHDGPTLRRWVLGLGDAIEVIEPAELRADVAAVARSVLKVLGCPPFVSGGP